MAIGALWSWDIEQRGFAATKVLNYLLHTIDWYFLEKFGLRQPARALVANTKTRRITGKVANSTTWSALNLPF